MLTLRSTARRFVAPCARRVQQIQLAFLQGGGPPGAGTEEPGAQAMSRLAEPLNMSSIANTFTGPKPLRLVQQSR